jgi:Cu2+-exporting ATPase
MRKHSRLFARIRAVVAVGFAVAAVFSLPLLAVGALLVGGFATFAGVFRRDAQRILSSLGLLVLAGLAAWQTLVNGVDDLWWQVGAVAALLSLRDWYLGWLEARVARSVPKLTELLPEQADVLDGKDINRVFASELRVGDIILVRPGSVVPADGLVVQGSTQVDEAFLTGDGFPVAKGEGDFVAAGTLNLASKKSNKSLTIRVTAVGSDLLVEGLGRSVAALAEERASVDVLSGKLAKGLFVLTLASALLACGLWLVLDSGSWVFAVESAAAVLLAVNVGLVSSASRMLNVIVAGVAGARGILVRGRGALYQARKSHIVAFNLVGTLTSGKPRLVKIHLARGTSLGSDDEVLAVAAALEANSDHVLAGLIRSEALARGVEPAQVYDLESHPMGVTARMDGSEVLVGGPGILTAYNVPVDVQDLVLMSSANDAGNSVVYVVVDALLVGYLEFRDEVRETAREAVTALHRSGKRVVAITGESAGVAAAVCASLGIAEHFAEVLPGNRVAMLDELRADGSIVTAVGDFQGDAPLLASANVGVALGVGSAIGAQSAEILVITSEPRAVSFLMRLAKSATRALNFDLVLLSLVNLAALGLAGWLALPVISVACVLASSVLAGWRIARLTK